MKLTALLAPLALIAAEDAPRFAPEAGSSLQKTFHEQTALNLDHVVMSVNGEEQDNPQELSMELSHERRVTVTDTYARVADGRVAKLARKFDAIEAVMEGLVNDGGSEEAIETSGEGDLSGHAVDFTWDASAGAYVATFAEDDDGEDDLLEGLEQDMDLVGFLPPAGTEEGASYDVAPAALQRVLQPGALGTTQFDEPGGDSDREGALFLSLLSARDAADEVEGEIKAKWVGSEEHDGRALAKIELEVDVMLASELIDKLTEMAEGMGSDLAQLDMFSDFTVEVALTGKGALLWDAAAGRVASLELSLDNETTLRLNAEEGAAMQMEVELTFLGTSDITVATR